MSVVMGRIARWPVLHAAICPVRSRYRRSRWHQPFWSDDKTAALLGIGHYGCPRCGRGSIKARDRERRV